MSQKNSASESTGFRQKWPSHPSPHGFVVKGLAQGRASGGHQGIRAMAPMAMALPFLEPAAPHGLLHLNVPILILQIKNIHQKSMQLERMVQTCSEELAEWLALLGSKSFSCPAKRCIFLYHDMWKNLWPGATKIRGAVLVHSVKESSDIVDLHLRCWCAILLTCAKRREFSGMIHWLTINNNPSNPHSHPFPT